MQPFVGEIKLFTFNWAPKGWALCNGALLAITQNQALFALLGTYYGGNGTTNFALPDLRSRVPLSYSGNYPLGSVGGAENVSLTINQIPSHQHYLMAVNSAGATPVPFSGLLSQVNPTTDLRYAPDASNVVSMNPASVQPAGGGQPHTNIQPYNALNYCIATVGVFPSRG